MKIIAFNGSPAGRKSITGIMLGEVLEGARQEGAETENVFLIEKKIEFCKGCFSCWHHELGKCAIEDDVQELLEKLKNADVAIFATPLYFDNVSALLKVFIERTLPLGSPYLGKDECGESRHEDREGFCNCYGRVPKIVMLSNAGLPEQSHFQVVSLYARRVARSMHTELIAEIYRGMGGLLSLPVEQLRVVVDPYKALLRKCGMEITKNGILSDDTVAQLNKPLVPVDMFIREANKYTDKYWAGRAPR
jgi:hypothetical protein